MAPFVVTKETAELIVNYCKPSLRFASTPPCLKGRNHVLHLDFGDRDPRRAATVSVLCLPSQQGRKSPCLAHRMVLWIGDLFFRLLVAEIIVNATSPDGNPIEDIRFLWPVVPIDVGNPIEDIRFLWPNRIDSDR